MAGRILALTSREAEVLRVILAGIVEKETTITPTDRQTIKNILELLTETKVAKA